MLGFIWLSAAFIVGLVIYFLPTIVASNRGIKNTLGVFILNFFLGLTLLGWVGALIWAVVEDPLGNGKGKSRRKRK